MPGIKTPVTDIISKLKTLAWPNNNGQTPGLYSAVWNNQFKNLEQGTGYAFPLPAAFVEVALPNNYGQLALGITASDVAFRIHIGLEQLDAGDGTLDQNLSIFDLRDAVIALLTYYEPTACSGLMKVSEEQDYAHNNLYVYKLDFKCSFIDAPGDQTKPQQDSTPPAKLILDIDYDITP